MVATGFQSRSVTRGSRLRLVLALPRADRPTCRGAGCAVGGSQERDSVTMKIAGILLALVEVAGPAAAQTRGLPTPTPSPAIYSRPTPAPLAPPINPGPAVVPPAGLSPLLTQPGPVFELPPRATPSYPPAPTPGPIDQQQTQSRNPAAAEPTRFAIVR